MLRIKREDDASPSTVWGKHLTKNGYGSSSLLPTNSWYLNLVSHRAATKPDDSTRVYTVPYIIDTASPEPIDGLEGIRVLMPVLQASDTNIQMVDNYMNGLCLRGMFRKLLMSQSKRRYGEVSDLTAIEKEEDIIEADEDDDDDDGDDDDDSSE